MGGRDLDGQYLPLPVDQPLAVPGQVGGGIGAQRGQVPRARTAPVARRESSAGARWGRGPAPPCWRAGAPTCHDPRVPPVPERILMGPGPSNPYPEVAAAMVRPVLGHLDPAFLAVLDETCDRLRTVFGTANALTLPLSGTGSAGMEASFVNWVRPGDTVVVGVNGLFGERMCEVAGRHGAEVVRVEAPWGQPLDPDAVLAAHPAPSMIAVVHAETSTGVRNEVAPLGQGKGDALLVVDTVTSLGGIPVASTNGRSTSPTAAPRSAWGFPRASHPSPSPIAPGPAWSSGPPAGTSTSTCCPLRRGRGRRPGLPPHRAGHHDRRPCTPGSARCSRRASPAAYARHAACAEQLARGLEQLGLERFAGAGSRLPQLTTVTVPEALPAGMDEAGVPAGPAGRLRHRDRSRGRPAGRPGVAHRLHGPHGTAGQRPGPARGHGRGPGPVRADGPHGAGAAAGAGGPPGVAAHADRRRLRRLVRGAEPLPGLAGAVGAASQGGARCRPRTAAASPPAAPSGTARASWAPATGSGSLSAGDSPGRSPSRPSSGAPSRAGTSATGSTGIWPARGWCPRRWWSCCTWPSRPSACTGSRSRSSPATAPACGWWRSWGSAWRGWPSASWRSTASGRTTPGSP